MESIQAIKMRLHSIGSTRQITQSMRLVSTAKAQKALLRMEENRYFFEMARRTAASVVKNARGYKHPYITARKVNSSAIIMINSDRGLCGGYNINVGKEAVALANKIGNTRIITVGAKAKDYCRRRNKEVDYSFQGVSENPFYEDAKEIGAIALKMYDNKEVDQIYIVYTQYQSMLIQNPKSIRLLPLDKDAFGDEKTPARIVRYEPGEERFLEQTVYMYMGAFLYGAMLESSACEQSARITSMDAAVKNSSEIIDSLTLLYNQARQGAITQELIEIVSGSNALEQSE